MNKATLERIMNPGVKWIVYLYVIPHYPHVMYYVGISSNSTKKRRENGYGHNPELFGTLVGFAKSAFTS